MRHVNFSHYMVDGLIAAINEIEKITGEHEINAIGYCIGGTLLAMTLSWLYSTKQQSYIKRATFLTTLLDFREAGDLCVFIDDEQIDALEKIMNQKGYLDGDVMKATFAMIRANDMIWSFVVNNYWMGRDPQAFDMLVWNSDTTNLPAAFQSDYLRSMYRDNKLATAGAYELHGEKIDIHSIKTPSYFLSAKDDHIAPWKATYRGMRMFAGPHVFTLAGSGHVAGVVNPPVKNKYGYWTSTAAPGSTEEWLKSAAHNEGSWWPHWHKWASQGDAQVAARKPDHSLAPAPGGYVKGEQPKKR
jgi:polyhydroxyalkanoate synthase